MSKIEAIARYHLIINKVKKHPPTFKEISDYLALESELQEYNFKVSKRTFERDLNDIRIVYNIDIRFDNKRQVYDIYTDQQQDVNERIMEAFDTFNALNITDRLSDHIHFEKRRPQGTENLYGLLHAIKNKVQIKFTYEKFWEEKPSFRRVEPYLLKEFKNRWYLLARDLKDERIKNFGLDRLKELEITKKRFVYPNDFDATEHFKHCFGIIGPGDQKPQEIILSFDFYQGKYIKSLPLHHSQKILVDNEEELRIKLTLYITHDFFMELLSFGKNVEVLEPISLVNDIKKAFQEALYMY